MTRIASVQELEALFQQELPTDRWAAAESAFALASRYRDAGDREKSREWVHHSASGSWRASQPTTKPRPPPGTVLDKPPARLVFA